MAHQPIFSPDSSGDPSSPKDGPSIVERNSQVPKPRVLADVANLASTLAAHGGGANSADLALDLVLNEIVEQARLATGASGAAIALTRGEEIVCRAATGPAAPDLGVRLDTHDGLSGACLRTRELQQCDDTETDTRVDREACRRLGIRSILVMPLMDQDELFGVLEIFSPQPHAFGQRDVYTLRALTYRILENRRQARQAVLQETSGSGTEVDTMVAQTPEPSATPPADADAEKATAWVPSFSAGLSARHPSFRSSDTLTTVLGVIVIGAAVVLGTLIGWRFGWQEAAMKARAISTRQSNPTAARASLNPAAGQSQESQPSVVPFTSTVPAPAASKPELSATAIAPAEPPPGGLVVYQKGKVVFRLIPSSTAGQPLPSQKTPSGLQTPTAAGLKASVPEVRKLSQEAAAARLIHRVLPQYPAQARDQQLQGPVLLDVQIGPDGNVQQVGVAQGNPLLAEAAVAAVKQWQYQPYEINGQRVPTQTRVTVNFKLKD